MDSILRVYDPAECDEHGVPLDWERCRWCADWDPITSVTRGVPGCARCAGHGSLKAAALAMKWDALNGCGYSPVDPLRAYRCESCGHPMSEGTWEDDGSGVLTSEARLTYALADLAQGREPKTNFVHYSPCDEGCRHGGPTRCNAFMIDGPSDIEASWRPVDVRTLGWAHDLRPEKLAVLCLRCFAERAS